MKNRKIEFHSLAAAEFLEAVRWYTERSPVSARKFVHAIDRAIQRIQTRDAVSFPIAGRTFRYARIFGFPYVLIFKPSLSADSLTMVYAVAHTSRRPGYWSGR